MLGGDVDFRSTLLPPCLAQKRIYVVNLRKFFFFYNVRLKECLRLPVLNEANQFVLLIYQFKLVLLDKRIDV